MLRHRPIDVPAVLLFDQYHHLLRHYRPTLIDVHNKWALLYVVVCRVS